MANIEKIVEELSTLTVMEAAELSKALEEKWGVSAAAAVAVAAPAVVARRNELYGIIIPQSFGRGCTIEILPSCWGIGLVPFRSVRCAV